MKRIISLLVIICFINLLLGCDMKTLDIVRIDDESKNTNSQQSEADILAYYNPNDLKGWQVDIRGEDISDLNLGNRVYDLLNSDFDTKTIWPNDLPSKFNPSKVIEMSKNPGLGISALHSSGITGKNINIAIIDGWMPDNHTEYKEKLAMCNNNNSPSDLKFHGSAVTSIAIGKNTGVAPEANLYFISASNFNSGKADFTAYAKAIEEIVEINKKLDNKIRVLSISTGWAPDSVGYTELNNAIKKAVDENIFVVTSNMFEIYANKFYFYGVEIDALMDRDTSKNYKVVNWDKWTYMANNSTGFEKYYEENFDKVQPAVQLLVPVGCKTVASQTGKDEYTFFRTSGWSWGIPYIAGLYALSCQAKPDITPDEFWEVSIRTGEQRIIEKGDKRYIGKLVNPQKLIAELVKNKKDNLQ